MWKGGLGKSYNPWVEQLGKPLGVSIKIPVAVKGLAFCPSTAPAIFVLGQMSLSWQTDDRLCVQL